MTSIILPVATLLIDILVACLFLLKKSQVNKETKIYSLLLIVNVIECLFNVIGIIYVRQVGDIEISSILQKIDMSMMVVWVCLMLIYVVSVSEIKKTNSKIYKGLLGLTFLICCVILSVPNAPIIDEHVIDSSGIATNIAYVTIAIYAMGIIFSVIYSIIKNKKNLFNKKYFPLYALVVLAILGLITRGFMPELVFEPFIMGYVVLLMYHTIENPDMRMIEQLNIAKDSAEKANRAKTDFLSSMSHEIRTPLNAIVGFSQCIDEANSLEEAKENAKDVISASSTLLEIVNGILDISKIEAGKLEIVNSSYDSKKLFEDVAKLVKPRMQEKALDFQIQITPDLPPVLYGDHANLKKVVTNILSNASKYTDKGYVKYSVNCVTNNNICRIIIAVEDSGRGIKKENIDKLFTKFQRLDEDRNTTIEGTGLGLAITQRILELMGGRIIVQSVYGSGSKFTVVVDQTIDLKNHIEEKEEKPIIEELDTIDYSKYKFLIVDDNKLNLKVATKVINSIYPVQIETVESGLDCICMIQANKKYDLILMDDMMPKMSGVETLNELKKIDGFNIPVIALTANAIAGMREKYLNDGFDEYLSKPIDKKELVSVLDKMFNKILKNEEAIENKKIEKVDLGDLPEDIFEIDTEDNNESVENEPQTSSKLTVVDLKNNGIDVDHGLELLGDMEMYNDTLKDFLNEIDDRINKLTEYKNTNNMTNYAIYVHALKSDSKYLGFMKLADLAYQHELKSKENDTQFVNENYEALINELNRVLEITRKYIKE